MVVSPLKDWILTQASIEQSALPETELVEYLYALQINGLAGRNYKSHASSNKTCPNPHPLKPNEFKPNCNVSAPPCSFVRTAKAEHLTGRAVSGDLA